MTQRWTIGTVLDWAGPYLTRHGSESGRLDGELLLCAVTGLRRLDLYIDRDRPLQGDELARFKGLIQRRARAEPVAYILGRKSFHAIDVEVGPGALVPRPETEHLVDRVVKYLHGKDAVAGAVLDVGTGTGAIVLAVATAIAAEDADRPLWATERSEAALAWARRNAARLGLEARVRVEAGDLLGPFGRERCAVLVSNPPYVRTPRLATLAPTVRAYEPREALDGGEDGLSVLQRLVEHGVPALLPGGLWAVELGDPEQGAAVVAALAAAGMAEARCELVGPGPTAIVSARKPLQDRRQQAQ